MTSPSEPQASSGPPEDSAKPETEAPVIPASSDPPADELPEWEPLTPEIVEEEAIRGDIVLRGAVILLALLFGWTQLSESSVLTRIQTGRYLASHGILPPRVDVFSYSTGDRPWINLGWLGDLWLAGVHGLGGDRLLTVWTASAAAAAFWLIGRTSLPGAPTWWNSILAAIALVAVFPWLTPGPEIVTVLGLAWLMWILRRFETRPNLRLALCVAPVFWLWSNSDPHAWIGLAVLWLSAIGSWVAGEDSAVEGQGTRTRTLLGAATIATLAAMIHPFHWHVLEAPYVQYKFEYPEIREYGALGPFFTWMWYPLTDTVFWRAYDQHAIAALTLAGLALLTLLLNATRLNPAHALIWLFANGAGAAAGHLLPVAAVLNAIIAGLNAQQWYARTFRQTYSVAWGELIFSRGGRALTVFGFFAAAYLMVNGALAGPDGRRLGMGFDWRLRTAIASYQRMTEGAFDDRPFNSRVEHGDVLIWVGQKPFVDSRIALFAHGPSNLLETHRNAYLAMWPGQEDKLETGRPDVWKETFDRYEITHVYTRLSGDNPRVKYRLLLSLLLNQELRLTRLGAVAAEFYRYDKLGDIKLRSYVDDQDGSNFVAQAFRKGDDPPATGTPAWPRELTTYDRWLIQPEQALSESAQLAQHYSFLAEEIPPRMAAGQEALDAAFALRTLAIRYARRALRDRPDSAACYAILGRMYELLDNDETAVMAGFDQPYPLKFRRDEMLAAHYSTLLTASAKASEHELLANLLAARQFNDTALLHFNSLHELTGDWTTLPPDDPSYEARRDNNRQMAQQLGEIVSQATDQAASELNKGTDVMAVAQAAQMAGCHKLALETISANETDLVQNPIASLGQCTLMLDVGRTEEAWERLEGMSSLMPPQSELTSIWRITTASANTAFGNYERTDDLLHDDAAEIAASRARAFVESGPLQSGIPFKHDLYAAARSQIAVEILSTFSDRWTQPLFLEALANLERGQNSEAATSLKKILDYAPDTSLRPLVAYYYMLVTGEPTSFIGPADRIPIWDGIFAADPVAPTTDSSSSPRESTAAEESVPPPPPIATEDEPKAQSAPSDDSN